MKSKIITLLMAGAPIVAACGSSEETPERPGLVLLENGKTHFGKTYGEYGAAWWKWYYELPTQGAQCYAPTADTTGEKCQVGQPSDVFFLVGTRGGNAERTKCVIPRGKPIFFPIVTFAADNGGVPLEKQASEAELEASTKTALRDMYETSLTLDGRAIETASLAVNVTKFSYTLPPEPNQYTCAGAPGVTGPISPAFHAGYYALLDPPAPGEHTIAFAGKQSNPGGPPFEVGVVYKVRVE